MTSRVTTRFRLDASDERLWKGDQPVQITNKAFQLLRYFVANPRRLLTKDELLEKIWPGVYVSEGLIKEYVHDLRLALDDDPARPRFIETVHGRGYRYLGGIEILSTATKQCFGASGQTSPPAVAVLPFDNTSGDPNQRYLAKGITEDIRTELSRFHSLRVIASGGSIVYKGQSVNARAIGRQLGVHYLIVGSVRKADERVRFTAQLLEAETGSHLWAEHYDRELTNVLGLQDEIAATVASTVAGRLRTTTQDRAGRKLTENLDAYDYVLLGQGIIADTKENNHRARQAYQRAVELDPTCATAYAGLAHSHAIDGLFGYREAFERSLDHALSYAVKGVALDNINSKAEWVLGHVLAVRREFEHANPHFDRALELNPLDADAHVMKGMYLAQAGSSEESIACYKTAIRLNPFYPGWYFWNLGRAYYATKRYRQALMPMKAFADRWPAFKRPQMNLAATYAQLGQIEEAQCVVDRILACAPDASLGQEHASLSRLYEDSRDLEHWLEGLRKAGLPE